MNETRWEGQKPDEALVLINTITLLKFEIFNHNIGIVKICEKIWKQDVEPKIKRALDTST